MVEDFWTRLVQSAALGAFVISMMEMKMGSAACEKMGALRLTTKSYLIANRIFLSFDIQSMRTFPGANIACSAKGHMSSGVMMKTTKPISENTNRRRVVFVHQLWNGFAFCQCLTDLWLLRSLAAIVVSMTPDTPIISKSKSPMYRKPSFETWNWTSWTRAGMLRSQSNCLSTTKSRKVKKKITFISKSATLNTHPIHSASFNHSFFYLIYIGDYGPRLSCNTFTEFLFQSCDYPNFSFLTNLGRAELVKRRQKWEMFH